MLKMENTVNSPLPSPPPKKKKKTHSALSCLYFNAHVTVIFLQVLETAAPGKRKRPVQGLMLHFMPLLSLIFLYSLPSLYYPFVLSAG